MALKYCSNCGKRVETEKDYNTALLIIALLVCFIPGVIYYMTADEVCPDCGGQYWGTPED